MEYHCQIGFSGQTCQHHLHSKFLQIQNWPGQCCEALQYHSSARYHLSSYNLGLSLTKREDEQSKTGKGSLCFLIGDAPRKLCS
ncbi:hypothetical protein FGO68_gene6096 [Halteria grandinella]|uniref:Uncharacterized protein n=1 Tax=Halteria grandinella TaxID=5974 RepID=A0A8J8NTG6_HALGN|nr:hypothetical protein FGO68_gene6096 [Halteria grandinella]